MSEQKGRRCTRAIKNQLTDAEYCASDSNGSDVEIRGISNAKPKYGNKKGARQASSRGEYKKATGGATVPCKLAIGNSNLSVTSRAEVEDSVVQQMHAKIAQLESELAKTKVSDSNAGTGNNYTYTRPEQGPTQRRGPIVCFRCSQTGHIARECPQAPWNQNIPSICHQVAPQ